MSLQERLRQQEEAKKKPPPRHLMMGDSGYGGRSWCGLSGLDGNERTDEMAQVGCKHCLEIMIYAGEAAYIQLDKLLTRGG